MELDDLPPRYRAQAEQQLAARKRRAADPLAEAVKQAKAAGRNFDSRGEYEFYTGTVLPKMARGEIVECEQHPAFPLFPAGEYGTMKLRPIRYTADFRLKSSKALPLTTAPSLRRRRNWNAPASISACPGLRYISATRIPLGSGAPTRTPTA